MKLASTLFGVIVAQDYEGSGTVDYTDSVTDYSDESERGKIKNQYQPVSSYNNNYQLSYNTNDYYGKSSGTHPVAVTCWESNNMGTHTPDSNTAARLFDQHSHEGHSPSTSSTDSSRDPYGWKNIHANHVTDATVNNAHSLDAYDHRLSGCIYELSSFTYSASTYNKYYTVTFSSSNGLSPVWWHYFNAHILLDSTRTTTPEGSPRGISRKASHDIVMANPTYEGLGYLNFIVTFVKKSSMIADDLSEYINTDESLHTDLFAPNDDISFSAATVDWYSTYTATNSGVDGTWVEKVAISSFPHNDLGKDFRFNIRILHKMGEGDQDEAIDSYYWYKVNHVTIVFPQIVGCPWNSHSVSNAQSYRCMDSADQTGRLNGHVSWDSVDNLHEDEDYATFIESFTAGAPTNNAVCSTAYAENKMACGTQYEVTGLMNTYDEYAQQEYGTHQEFWFQFEYYYVPDPALNTLCDRNNYGCYQSPNMLFNAFEIESVTIACSQTGLYNSNRCQEKSTNDNSVETWS